MHIVLHYLLLFMKHPNGYSQNYGFAADNLDLNRSKPSYVRVVDSSMKKFSCNLTFL